MSHFDICSLRASKKCPKMSMLVHQFTSTPKVLDIRTKDPRNFSVMGQAFPVKLMKHQLDRSINWNQTDITFQLIQDLSVGFHSKGVANAYKRPSKFLRYGAGVYCKTDQASDKQ